VPEQTDAEEEFDDAQDESQNEGFPIPAVQVADSEWVVMMRSLSWLSSEQIDNVPKEAKFLSEKFQTNVFTMMEEDTSSAVGYELFEKGESIESLEFCDADEYRFSSQRQEDLQFKSGEEDEEDEDLENEHFDNDNDEEDYLDYTSHRQEMQFIDRVVADLGLYIPAVWYFAVEGKPAIQVMPASMGTIARADWLTVTENWEIAPTVVDDDDAE
jgi:hypothetical protein